MADTCTQFLEFAAFMYERTRDKKTHILQTIVRDGDITLMSIDDEHFEFVDAGQPVIAI